MKLLLDTDVFLWWLADERRLGRRAREAIASEKTLAHVSAASIWEASIKTALGRLEIRTDDLASEIERNGFTELPIRARHGLAAGRLPAHHEDPFDRILIAQAILDDLILVTADRVLERYAVRILRG